MAAGADPAARCKQKFTALHWICGERITPGHLECAAVLTAADESLVNAADGRGLTALHWANAEQVP